MHPPDARRGGEYAWKIIAPMLILIGAALRAAYAFPVHRFPADADCLMAGLRAFRILEGQFPVFLMPPRIGSLECYGHALAFSILGVSRASLSVTPLVSGILLLVVFAFLCKSILGPRLGLVALLLLAVPPASYLFWTYMPNSYAETMLLSGCFLALAVKMDAAGETTAGVAALGLLGGLSWWQSLLTLGCVLPSAAWYFLRSPRPLGRRLLLFGLAFLVGASPWTVFNIRHRFSSFRESYATAPVSSLKQSASNAAYVAADAVPELLASLDPQRGHERHPVAHRVLQVVALALCLLSALAALLGVARRWHKDDRSEVRSRPPGHLSLLLAIAAVVCLLPVFSRAGDFRGLQSRYVILLMLAMPLLVAWFLGALARRLFPLGVLLLASVLASNCWAYALPGSAPREAEANDAKATDQLVDFLRQRKIDAICGDYWLVYGINFLSRESIVGAPLNQNLDYLRYGPKLPHRPLRWALVSRRQGDLRKWAGGASLPGTISEGAPEYYVFLPDPNPPSAEIGPKFLGRLREAYYLK
jgi:hypothetical protein